MRHLKKSRHFIVTLALTTFVLGYLVSCTENVQSPHTDTENSFVVPELFKLTSSAIDNGETILIAGKTKNIGNVKVTNDLDSLYIYYETVDMWYLTESKIHVGKNLEDFPFAGRSGNPVPGKFDLQFVHNNGTKDFQVSIPLGQLEANDKAIIALHADVEEWINGKLSSKEGAWASGERFTERGNWATYFYYVIEETGLTLSNSLSSFAEIENGLVGPAGTIIGNVNFNHIVKSGPGITPNTGFAGSGVDFPTTLINPDKGSIELWAQFYEKPAPYSHGVYGFVNVNHWRVDGIPDNIMVFAWHNSESNLNFSLRFNGNPVGISYKGFEPPLNTPVHLAIAWDRDGINETGDYMRIYVNGETVASNSTVNSWGNDNTKGAFRIAAPWDSNFSIDRYTVAELKVWDHSKVEF